MRICYIANPNTVHVQRWLRHFAARHDVHLLAVNQVTVGPERLDGVTVHDLSFRHRVPLPLRAWEIARARMVLRRLRPDVLHAHYVARYGWLAALSGYRPCVLTAWGGDVLPDQGAYDTWIARRLTPLALRRAAAVTVDAPDVFEICRRFTRPGTPVVTVTFGADPRTFHPGRDVAALRRQLDLPPAARVVLSPRILAPLYNIDRIVCALPLVRSAGIDAVLLIQSYTSLADPAYDQRVRRLVDELGLQPHVRFLPEADHGMMADLYNLSDVVVSVPSSDGLPATFFEAMACGAPLIVSDLPAYEGVILDRHTGLRVPAGDERQLGAAIVEVLTSGQLAARIRTGALRVFEERGNFLREMERVDELYVQLAAGSR